ncbi:MAG: hypothetical protein IV090_26095 [Candidatus Sericytochromatia bacterium]|nr:hypothetical protein [Candidatus Sericytochromatia bacterium]
MTSLNVESTTVPFNDVLYPMLQTPRDAAEYLFDAFGDTKDNHAIVNALKDIILANRQKWVLPLLSVYFSVGRINATKLEGIIDFMEETLEPDVRSFLASSGATKALRFFASEYRKRGGKVKFNLNININTDGKPGPGMQEAQNALKNAFADNQAQAALLEMQSVLIVA